MTRLQIFRMVLTDAVGDGSEDVKEHAVSVTELVKNGKRDFRVTVGNLKTGIVFKSPMDNDKILQVLPLEFWPPFVHQSLLVGKSDLQSPLF